MVVRRTQVRLFRAIRACCPFLPESRWSLWEKQSEIRQLVWTKSLTFSGAFSQIPCVILGETASSQGIFPSPNTQGRGLPKSGGLVQCPESGRRDENRRS